MLQDSTSVLGEQYLVLYPPSHVLLQLLHGLLQPSSHTAEEVQLNIHLESMGESNNLTMQI